MKTSTKMAAALAAPAVRTAAALTAGHRTLTLVGWHRIGDSPDGLTTHPDDFVRHLDVLEEWGGTVLPLDEAHRLLLEDRLPERAVALTFDDGYASVLEQAWPELRRRGLPATLFAVSDYLCGRRTFPWDHRHPAGSELTRLATAADVRAAAEEGLDIGSHTATHRWLPSLSDAEVREELLRSRDDLEDLLDRPITSFAYPMGGVTPAVRDLVADAGYRTAITTERGRNAVGQDPILLRRAFAFDRPRDVRRQLDGAFTWMRMIERHRVLREPTW